MADWKESLGLRSAPQEIRMKQRLESLHFLRIFSGNFMLHVGFPLPQKDPAQALTPPPVPSKKGKRDWKLLAGKRKAKERRVRHLYHIRQRSGEHCDATSIHAIEIGLPNAHASASTSFNDEHSAPPSPPSSPSLSFSGISSLPPPTHQLTPPIALCSSDVYILALIPESEDHDAAASEGQERGELWVWVGCRSDDAVRSAGSALAA